MSADKHEAGRTCKRWCGTTDGSCFPRANGDPHYITAWGAYVCSLSCLKAGKPLNPAPRHVEQSLSTFATDGDQPIICDTPGCGRPIPAGGEGHPEICPKCLDDEEAQRRSAPPRPIERCSCEEASRYKEALKRILTVLDVDDDDAEDLDTAVEAIVVVMGIARRALVLGEENGNDG